MAGENETPRTLAEILAEHVEELKREVTPRQREIIKSLQKKGRGKK